MAVYNVEKYIRKAIEGIINQTFNNFELICIDDGSTDSSGLICDEYSKKDKRIIVIHKKNGGVALARQSGLDAARGEYIANIDSDDWIEPNYLKEMYENAKRHNSDILFSDYYINNDKGTEYITLPTLHTAKDCICYLLEHKLRGALWNVLIRTSIIKNYNIRLIPNINCGEDQLLLIQTLMKSKKITQIHKAFYHYYIREGSITRSNQMNIQLPFIRNQHLKEYYKLLEKYEDKSILSSINTYKLLAFTDILKRRIQIKIGINTLPKIELNEIRNSNISFKLKLIILLIKYSFLKTAYIIYCYYNLLMKLIKSNN